jgi:hypothetical protein
MENKYYAAGTYQVTINMEALPAGNYLYQLLVGENGVVKKLMAF